MIGLIISSVAFVMSLVAFGIAAYRVKRLTEEKDCLASENLKIWNELEEVKKRVSNLKEERDFNDRLYKMAHEEMADLRSKLWDIHSKVNIFCKTSEIKADICPYREEAEAKIKIREAFFETINNNIDDFIRWERKMEDGKQILTGEIQLLKEKK